jgi:hypothetical protein
VGEKLLCTFVLNPFTRVYCVHSDDDACAVAVLTPAEQPTWRSDNRLMPCVKILLFSVVLLLAACSPTYNWRDVKESELALAVQFPCKPQRVVQGRTGMLQCEAGGARFVLGWRDVPTVGNAASAMATASTSVLERIPGRPAGVHWQEISTASLPEGAQRRELRWSSQSLQMQLWVRGPRLFQAMVLGADQELQREAGAWFLDHLQVPN